MVDTGINENASVADKPFWIKGVGTSELSATHCDKNVQFLTFMQDLLVTVFENGGLVREYSFEEIRERAELPLVKKRRQERKTS